MNAVMSIAASTACRLRSGHALLFAILLNSLLLALYALAAQETTLVEIHVAGDRLSATLNGSTLVAGDSTTGNRVLLYLAGPEQRWTYVAPGPPEGSPLAWLRALTARLSEEPLGAAWASVAVLDGRGQVLWDERPAAASTGGWGSPSGGRWISLPAATPAEEYVVRALLRRGAAPAGILVQASDAANGMLLLIRPEFRDFQWFRLRDGQLGEPLASGFWSKSALALLQDDLRLLLATQVVALAIILAFLALGGLLSRAGDGLADLLGRQADRRGRLSGRSGRIEGKPAPLFGGPAPRPGELPHPRQGSGPCPIAPTTNGECCPAARARFLTPPPSTPITRRYGRALGDWTAVLAALIALGLAAVAGYVALVLLEAIPHVQDDVTYLFQARVFALGRLWVPASPIPEAFEQEFIVNFAGRAFGKYPPGHSLILLPGVLANAAWLVNPLQAGLTVVVIYLIGREIHGRGSGLLAALLLATSPFVIFMSGSMMAHPTGLLFFSLFLLFFVKASNAAPRPAIAVLSGLALGFVFITRPWTAVGLGAPFALYAGYRVLRHGPPELRRYGPVVLGFAPLALGLLIYNYALTGIPLKNPMELWWPFDKLGFGTGIGISGAHTLPAGLWNTYRNLTELMANLYGWPAYLTLSLALVPFLTRRASRWDWLFLVSWLSLVVAHVAWWADGVMYGPRYYYEAVGLLVLLTARGVAALAEVALPRLPYLFAIALIGYNCAHFLPDQWTLHRGYNYVNGDSLRAVRERGVHDAVVFVDLGKWYEWWNYGSVFPANTPTLDGDVVYARDRGEAENRRVMQLYPGRRYYRLSGTTIEELP